MHAQVHHVPESGGITVLSTADPGGPQMSKVGAKLSLPQTYRSVEAPNLQGYASMHEDIDMVHRHQQSSKLGLGEIARCVLYGKRFRQKLFDHEGHVLELPQKLKFRSDIQRLAFEHICTSRPIALLKGLPGFGKTWLMCAYMLASILSRSQNDLQFLYVCQSNPSFVVWCLYFASKLPLVALFLIPHLRLRDCFLLLLSWWCIEWSTCIVLQSEKYINLYICNYRREVYVIFESDILLFWNLLNGPFLSWAMKKQVVYDK